MRRSVALMSFLLWHAVHGVRRSHLQGIELEGEPGSLLRGTILVGREGSCGAISGIAIEDGGDL